jgi:hypothetical protein
MYDISWNLHLQFAQENVNRSAVKDTGADKKAGILFGVRNCIICSVIHMFVMPVQLWLL